MNALSLFDGMSGARLALDRAEMPVKKYFASEKDKYAIKIAMKNYPDTVQLGDVLNWREWIDDLPRIDLLIGGSPCQGFSIVGKRLNFDDPRSQLFFEFDNIRIYLKKKNPNLKFMLENVRSMKDEIKDLISQTMGVEPVMIDSALVCAQVRKRYYWANWRIEQPEDRHIYLRDIIEADAWTNKDKSYCLGANMMAGMDDKDKKQFRGKRQIVFKKETFNILENKSLTLLANYSNATRGGYVEGRRHQMVPCPHAGYVKNHGEWSPREKSTCLDANYHKGADNHGQRTMIRICEINGGGQGNRVYSIDGKAACLKNESGGRAGMAATLICSKGDDNKCYRKLTPLECERLQGVPEGFTEGVSNTQRYKMLGNGFQIDTVAHNLRQSKQ
jgi:DNA (cytosine-5)-methyltransferase 3A